MEKYIEYKDTIQKIKNIIQYSKNLIENNMFEFLKKTLEKEELDSEYLKISISFEGTANSGKSTFLNTICGKEVIPTCETPETTTFVALRYNEQNDYLFQGKIIEFKNPEDDNEILRYLVKTDKNPICEGIENIKKYLEQKNLDNRKKIENITEEDVLFIVETKLALIEKMNEIKDKVQFIDTQGYDDIADYFDKQENIKNFNHLQLIHKLGIHIRVHVITIENYAKKNEQEFIKKTFDDMEKTLAINPVIQILNENPKDFQFLCCNKFDLLEADNKKNKKDFLIEQINRIYQKNYCLSARNYLRFIKFDKLIENNDLIVEHYIEDFEDEMTDSEREKEIINKKKKIIKNKKKIENSEFYINFIKFQEDLKKQIETFYAIHQKKLINLKSLCEESIFEKITKEDNFQEIHKEIGQIFKNLDERIIFFYFKFKNETMNLIRNQIKLIQDEYNKISKMIYVNQIPNYEILLIQIVNEMLQKFANFSTFEMQKEIRDSQKLLELSL